MKTNFCRFDGSKKFSYKKFNTGGESEEYDRKKIEKEMQKNINKMKNYQDRFYADGKEAFLVIFQAMDAGGKDGAIKHVMSGIDPQGVRVTSFKKPSVEELSHDYLWRIAKALPKRGEIGILNRSYYEEVLVSKVHELYKFQNLPQRCLTRDIIKQRYEQIADFEKYLWQNGITIVKFMLCISKEEQKRRFIKRIEDSSKNWKLSEQDINERKYWEAYMEAYQKAVNKTSTKYAPWYVVPADKKWYARGFVLQVILNIFEKINPKYPRFSKNKKSKLDDYKKILQSEKK
ncbi:MAG: polyphosphate kinase 2 family protein [Oscillospiraceae bacterium]|jgi:PPK2 family polyphosphate:nucleotide phosphotransferase|nr:polyphosphate kinase 2 family protein [Oscillospiraceae bacterium]